jgi:hypothetical protein
MAHRNGYDFEIGEPHRVRRTDFFPLSSWYTSRERRTARAQDNRSLLDKTWQLPDVVTVLMADEKRVHVCHAKPDTVQRAQQSAHANPAVDQNNCSCRSQQERVSRAATAETRNCKQRVVSESVRRLQASACLVQVTLKAARE